MRSTFLALLFVALFVKGTVANERPRLFILGDSLTGGMSVSSEYYAFKHIVAKTLNMDLVSFSKRNLPGVTEAWVNSGANWNADIVIIEVGLNDVSGFGGTALPEEEWLDAYLWLVTDIQKSGAEVYVATMFAGKSGEKYDRYNGYIREVSRQTGAGLIDLALATADCEACISTTENTPFTPWDPHVGDDFHPSNYGHAVIANEILTSLKRRIFTPMVSN